ncbi:hypothetical protein SDC9_168199 [bioreactor metagenome]|uniref:Uncharacterized protein n=1 Tax=bioreactor metagenome TaxID=1076179 RepID=A0A645G4H5_9ZZZZ
MDGVPRFSKMHLGGIDYTASATACWVNDTNFYVWVRPLGAVGQRRLRFEFYEDGSVILHPSSFQNMNYVGNDLSLSYVNAVKNALVKNIISFSFSKVIPSVVEPKHICKLVDKVTVL